MENAASFLIEVEGEKDRTDAYVNLITLGKTTRREHELLVHIASSEKEIGKNERASIRDEMGISKYQLNNLLASLRDKGFVKKDPTTKRYSFAFTLPNDPVFQGMPRLVFEFVNKEQP